MNTQPSAKLLVTGISIIFCLVSNNLFADCDSISGTHYPTINQPNYQGSAHTDNFDCAVSGKKQLTIDEVRERAGYLPPKLSNRFYFRIGGNIAAEGLTSASIEGVNNTSTLATGSLLNTSNKVASNNFEMAFGYVWKEFAVDLEWLASKSVDLDTPVIDITPTFTLNSNVKGDALLGNIYWIFHDMYNVKLYGDFIIGLSKNDSTSYINSGDVTAVKRTHWAFGLAVGARFNIVSKLYADIRAKGIYLGTARLQATDGSNYAYVKIQRNWLGASVCLLWLI